MQRKASRSQSLMTVCRSLHWFMTICRSPRRNILTSLEIDKYHFINKTQKVAKEGKPDIVLWKQVLIKRIGYCNVINSAQWFLGENLYQNANLNSIIHLITKSDSIQETYSNMYENFQFHFIFGNKKLAYTNFKISSSHNYVIRESSDQKIENMISIWKILDLISFLHHLESF